VERNIENQSKGFISPPKYKILPSGINKAKLVSFLSSIGKFDQLIFILQFEILEGEYRGYFVKGRVNQSSNGKFGKLWQLFRAMGVELDIFDQYDLKDLIAKECFINVETRSNGNAITEFIPLNSF